uniref:Uncharacterized protein n=1 Tax=uncultured marine microorganism HF4000_ANIW141K23 TaxID=455538 RepID=B3T5N3_9ZZZZ|nr:hypothetical protein ALOHA_HF4000ANIW141K23ctg1g2 [uncultured marine microorganism HF4000_ANIW141K23]
MVRSIIIIPIHFFSSSSTSKYPALSSSSTQSQCFFSNNSIFLFSILGPKSQFPNSFKLSKETVSIPVYPSLTNSEIDIILSVLVKK